MDIREFSVNDLCLLFNVSIVTVYNWRVKPKKRTPLPFHTRNRGTQRQGVYFHSDEVIAWAKENKLRIQEDKFQYLGKPMVKLSGDKNNSHTTHTPT